jgi:hypothetical protein
MTHIDRESPRKIAESVFAHATAHSERIEQRLGRLLSDDQFRHAVVEFVAFLLHESVVTVFNSVGREDGGRLVDEVLRHLNALGTSISLCAAHPVPPFIWKRGGVEYIGLNNDLVNARHSEYLRIEMTSGGGAESMPELTRVFVKHVAKNIDADGIESLAAAEASVAYLAFTAALGDTFGGTHMERMEVLNYGPGSNVLCKACGLRKIFFDGPTKTTVRDGRRYLELRCPSGTCAQVRTYEESELEIR